VRGRPGMKTSLAIKRGLSAEKTITQGEINLSIGNHHLRPRILPWLKT
jgi:hypothetical protein